jgi:hypothetical protein
MLQKTKENKILSIIQNVICFLSIEKEFVVWVREKKMEKGCRVYANKVDVLKDPSNRLTVEC